jgi:GNAT superfamily N-acetyltransferase
MKEDSTASAVAQEYFSLRDGRRVVLRPVVPEDAPRLARLCERLSAESSRLRFFRAGRSLTPQEALGVADIDHDRNEGLVALNGDRIVALGTFNQLGDEPDAELTLLVDDAYQGGGLGRHMLKLLIDAARARQYRMLLTELLPDNERMSGMLESAGVPSISDTYFGVLRVHLFLERDVL